MSASSGRPLLVAEALDGDLHPLRVADRECRDESVLELVHVEIGRVDHEIGARLHRVEQIALVLDRLEDTPSVTSAYGCRRRVAS